MTSLPANLEPMLCRFFEGERGGIESLHTRGKNRGCLLRLPQEMSCGAVIKVWKIRNLKERLKSILQLSNGRREWRMHRFIYKSGIEVPAPLAFQRLTMSNGDLFELMAIEDLGETWCGLPYLKNLLEAGDVAGIANFENRLVQITAAFVKVHVLDVDHQLNNFVLDERGRLMRIDFECARRRPLCINAKRDVAEMLARLIASHIYAVQPEVNRSVAFAEQLFIKLGISPRVRRMVSTSVNEKLEKQNDRKGIAKTVALPI
jgi:hypothetical protein